MKAKTKKKKPKIKGRKLAALKKHRRYKRNWAEAFRSDLGQEILEIDQTLKAMFKDSV